MGLSKCFLEGPEDCTFGTLGEPNGGMRLRSCQRGLPSVVVGRRRQNRRYFFGIVAQVLGELPPKGVKGWLKLSALRRVTGRREEGPGADANSSRFKMDPTLCLGRPWTGAR